MSSSVVKANASRMAHYRWHVRRGVYKPECMHCDGTTADTAYVVPGEYEEHLQPSSVEIFSDDECTSGGGPECFRPDCHEEREYGLWCRSHKNRGLA